MVLVEGLELVGSGAGVDCWGSGLEGAWACIMALLELGILSSGVCLGFGVGVKLEPELEVRR